jgi:uncharacterized protein
LRQPASGMTSVGGGALMTPLLILLFEVHPATAIGTDLFYAAATETPGTLVHGLNRSIDWCLVSGLAAGKLPTTALTLHSASPYRVSTLTAAGRRRS